MSTLRERLERYKPYMNLGSEEPSIQLLNHLNEPFIVSEKWADEVLRAGYKNGDFTIPNLRGFGIRETEKDRRHLYELAVKQKVLRAFFVRSQRSDRA